VKNYNMLNPYNLSDMQPVKDQIEALKPWFHNLHLPDNNQTNPSHFLGDFPRFKWVEISPFIPEDLTGWNVLDIGCNAGFYSFELAKRGAEVTGIDLDPHYLKQANWAANVLGLSGRVTFRQMQVYDLARENIRYDLIWFMGVFYHLRYPLLALDIISQRMNNLLVFQTLMTPDREEFVTKDDYAIHEREDMMKKGWPALSFIENKLAGDPTNWWAINHGGVTALLRSCGMDIVHRPLDETYICKRSTTNSSVLDTWNMSEYLAAIGEDWSVSSKEKVKKNHFKP
jgi:tRNA (mo5U34)-methyltransferase